MTRPPAIAAELPRSVDPERWIDPAARPETRAHLVRVLQTFNDAAHATLVGGAAREPDELYRPYAVEGSGFGFALLEAAGHAEPGDLETPWLWSRTRKRLFSLGVGMGRAFLQRDAGDWPEALRAVVDQPYALDGFGFYAFAMGNRPPPSQPWAWSGAGRALWFRCHRSPDRLVDELASIPVALQWPTWHGIGLAAGFTGGATASELRALVLLAGAADDGLTRGARTGLGMRRGLVAWPLEPAREVFAPVTVAEPVGVVA